MVKQWTTNKLWAIRTETYENIEQQRTIQATMKQRWSNEERMRDGQMGKCGLRPTQQLWNMETKWNDDEAMIEQWKTNNIWAGAKCRIRKHWKTTKNRNTVEAMMKPWRTSKLCANAQTGNTKQAHTNYEKWKRSEATMGRWWNNGKRTNYERIKMGNTRTLVNNERLKQRRNKDVTIKHDQVMDSCANEEYGKLTPKTMTHGSNMKRRWGNGETMNNEQIMNG